MKRSDYDVGEYSVTSRVGLTRTQVEIPEERRGQVLWVEGALVAEDRQLHLNGWEPDPRSCSENGTNAMKISLTWESLGQENSSDWKTSV